MVEMSPIEWVKVLEDRLTVQKQKIALPRRYYEGDQPLPLKIPTRPYREEFWGLIETICDNWMALVVDAVEERLHIDGFRVDDQLEADRDAWNIWQRNSLDADSELAHSTALQCGICPVLVWGDESGKATITVEDPSEMYVAYESGSRRHRVAALKRWTNEWTNEERATIYLPDKLHNLVKGGTGTESTEWRLAEEPAPNPLKVVPVVEFVNRPRLLRSAVSDRLRPGPAGVGFGRSEIADVMTTQDQINKLVCDFIIAAEFAAFRQRWATGVEADETDPDTGEATDGFVAGVNRLWEVANDRASFGEFAATDLAQYVRSIENRIQSLASRTRTPPHYLLGQAGSFPSGESLRATETGLVAKVRSRARHFGERWEEVQRLAGAIEQNRTVSEAVAMETIWADPEYRTEAEHTDSLGKLRQMLSMPLEELWADAGKTPEQIARMKRMLLEESIMRIAAGEVPQPPTGADPNDPEDDDAGAGA